MKAHLQEREHYEDRYDRITVESCRRREQFFLGQGENNGDVYQKHMNGIAQVGWAIEETLITLDWYNGKESTIKEWMDADKARDEMLATTTPPKKIFCDTCYKELREESRTTWERGENEEVLFFMKCSSGHLPMKGVFSDGHELKIKDRSCPECREPLDIKRLPSDEEEIVTEYSCTACDYTETDSFSLSPKEEIDDPEYNKDRVRFCLSGERLEKAQQDFMNMENMKRLVDKIKHEENHKDEYAEVEKLEKLTVPQVKQRILELLDDAKYLNLTFEKPSMEKYVSMKFCVEEMETDNQNASTHDLQKLIRNSLKTTNWRLMTGGISYRLGLMTGRLRAYESKEDMLKLVSKQN